MSGPITFGGLSSGLDTNSIITKLVQIEKQPIVDMQTSVTAAQNRQSILADLSTKLSTLQTSLSALNTQAGVQGRTVNVAAGATYTATAAGNAAVGNYNVVVSQLAQAQRTYSNTYSDPAAKGLTAGTITISEGGKKASISVTGADSLNTVASKINSSGLNLSASVVYDGTKYRMVVNGEDTGQQNAIKFTDSGTGLGLNLVANTVLAAKDAKLTVDGLAVTAATNTVTGIVPGVTLTLSGTAKTHYTLSVTDDPTKLQTTLQSVATAYNAVMDQVNKQMPKAGATSQPGAGSLAADPAVLQLQSTMRGLTVLTGGPKGNAFTSLVEIGISVDRYGTMSLDTNRLQTALATHSGAVTDLLVGTNGTNGLSTKLANRVTMYTDPVGGVLTSDSQGIGRQITTMNHSIDRMSRLADVYQQGLQNQFSVMEQLISRYNGQTSSLQGILNNSSNGK